MSRTWKLSLAAVAGALATFTVPTVWGKPWSINHFYMRTLVEGVWKSPELCSQLHFLDWRSGELDELTVAARDEGNALTAKSLATLHRYDRKSMSPDEQVSYDVMEFFLSTGAATDSGLGGFSGSPYAMEQLGGVHVAFPDFMTNQHDVHSASDAEHYIDRLEKVGRQFDEVIATANDDAAHGIVPPKFVLALVDKDARAFAAKPTAENPLVTTLAKKLDDVKDLDASKRADLLARASKAVDEVVKPAYGRYVDAVVALSVKANDDAGLWHTRGGDARYARYLRAGTASDLTPDEVHAMGLAEVERLEGEIRAVLAKIAAPAAPAGTADESPEAQVRKLHDDPRFLFPATDDGRKQILDAYQAILDDMAGKLFHVSQIPLPVPMKVEPVPAFKELTAPAAYYNPPPIDDAKPGTFYVNLSLPQFKYGMRTLAYHEGIPGHHFQQTVARHEKDLPMFRQLVPFNSYVEGWALWAEQCAADTGFEEDPYDRLGFLSEQLLRASRLVVDTGLHAKHWTREQAVTYFLAHTTADAKEVAIEVDRYIVWPGQACGYMVGKKTLERLAGEAKAALGEKYTLQDFNDVVLKAGALPMPVLEGVVHRWISEHK